MVKVNDEVYKLATIVPNANDIAMDGGDGGESSDSDFDISFPGNGTASVSPGAAEWIAETKGKLTPTQADTLEIAKMHADLDRTLIHLAGDDNDDINDLWGSIVARQTAELTEKEKDVAAARDKQEKTLR